MKVDRPIAKVWHTLRKSVTLRWADGFMGEYCVRGGAAWPTADEAGCLIAAGWSVERNRLIVFEDVGFVTVPAIVGPTGMIEQAGAASWIEQVGAVYGLRVFYDSAALEEQATWIDAVLRCPDIQRKPSIARVPVDDPARVLLTWQHVDRLTVPEESLVGRAMAQQAGRLPGAAAPAPLRALASLLASFDYMPWRGAQQGYETPWNWDRINPGMN